MLITKWFRKQQLRQLENIKATRDNEKYGILEKLINCAKTGKATY
jgi:hypothetical protein